MVNGALINATATAAEPAVAHLLIMHARIVDGGCKIEHPRRQPSHRVQDAVRRDDAIVLSGDERDACIYQRLLRVQHVGRGALPGLGLFANVIGRRHLRLRGGDLRLAGYELSPGRDRVRADLVAGLIEIEALLRQALLGLANRRILDAALVNRYRKLRDRRSTDRPVALQTNRTEAMAFRLIGRKSALCFDAWSAAGNRADRAE
jgi:hypothetical protein